MFPGLDLYFAVQILRGTRSSTACEKKNIHTGTVDHDLSSRCAALDSSAVAKTDHHHRGGLAQFPGRVSYPLGCCTQKCVPLWSEYLFFCEPI